MSQIEFSLNGFKWIDCVDPKRELLEQLASDLCLPNRMLFNCLDSDYLPHIESYGQTQFIILRIMEPSTKIDADSIQELTTKIAIFTSPTMVVSIHRLELNEIKEVEKKVKSHRKEEFPKEKLLAYFLEVVAHGFDRPLAELENKLQQYEERIFQNKKVRLGLLEGYFIKRKASAFKKVLKLTNDVADRIASKTENAIPLMLEVRDRLARNLFYAENVHENIQAMMSLHMSVEAQKTNEASLKTNEIMRILTVLTIFFLPLNFLAGIFGMNFQHMPLLSHPFGFWLSIVIMSVVTVGLSIFVLRQGWVQKPDLSTEMKHD